MPKYDDVLDFKKRLLVSMIEFAKMPHNLTSISLIGRLRDPEDVDAWNRFSEIYAALIEGWLRRRGVPTDIAEDVRQEVFSKVFQEIGQFDHNGHVGAFRKWLRTMMQHRLRTIQRKMWRSRKEECLAWSDVVNQLEDDQSQLSRLWNAEHDAHLIDRLMTMVASEFTEVSLQAFRRVVLNNEDVQSVANDLQISANAVRIAQTRVLASLRRIGEGLII